MKESTKKSIKNLFSFLGIWLGGGVIPLVFFIIGQETGDGVFIATAQVLGFFWIITFFAGMLSVCVDDIKMGREDKLSSKENGRL